MPCFGLFLGKFGKGRELIQDKTDGLSSQDTLSFAAEPFHVLHIDSLSGVLMCNQLLVAQLCHPMPCFGLGWKRLAQAGSETKMKLKVFPVKKTPYHLLLNRCMSSIWIQ
jgi:hypothetical protein